MHIFLLSQRDILKYHLIAFALCRLLIDFTHLFFAFNQFFRSSIVSLQFFIHFLLVTMISLFLPRPSFSSLCCPWWRWWCISTIVIYSRILDLLISTLKDAKIVNFFSGFILRHMFADMRRVFTDVMIVSIVVPVV